MSHVFIAYAPGDEAPALIVDAYLRAAGLSAERGQDNRDLPTHMPDQMTQHWASLRTAAAFVLLWSRRAAISVKARCDWEYALRRKIPVFILWLDSTPLPVALHSSTRVAALPGPDTLPRLVRALKDSLSSAQAVTFHTPVEQALVDFICWFFDDVRWDYQSGALLPLTARGIPNLPADEAFYVKCLCDPVENIWPYYATISRPRPLLVLEMNRESYERHLFLQAECWYYADDSWEPYSWVQCEACKRWQLASEIDDRDDIYLTWCPWCGQG